MVRRMARRPLMRMAVLSALLAGYWIALFAGTHYPRPPRSSTGHEDKLLHLAAFAGLAVLICLAARVRGRRRLGFYLKLLLVLAAYGAIDERSQPWVGRTCSLGDWIADVAGAVLGVLVFAGFDAALARTRRQENSWAQGDLNVEPSVASSLAPADY